MFITVSRKNIMLAVFFILALIFAMYSLQSYRENMASIDEHIDSMVKDELEENDKPLAVSSPINVETEIDSKPSIDNYFVDYRLQRDRVRSQQIEILREIVNNPNSNTENRKVAQEKLFQISDNLEKEMELENLLAAKGYMKVAVLIQPSSVTVVIGQENLSDQDIAKISDLTVSTTDYKLEDVIILPTIKAEK